MRKMMLFILIATAASFTFDFHTVFSAMRGYEDFIIAFMLSALVSPFLVPVFE